MLVDLMGAPAHPNWRIEEGKWRAGTMPKPYVRIGFRRADGTIQWEWRANVARVDPVMLNCATYLYRDEDEAATGSQAGGTAFNLCAGYGDGSDSLLVYMVTARHCIERGFTTVRANAKGGGFEIATIPLDRWHFHKDGTDIAVAVMGGFERTPDITFLPADFGVTRDYDIGIGDAVFMVGRLLLHDGRHMNIPSLRFGNVSMMPDEPLPAPAGLHADQEAFVVEMRSVGGYSGSPVFIYDDAGDNVLNSSRLLGIDYCHLATWGDENAGVAGVIPAWKIHELLYEDEDVLMERAKERKREWRKREEGAPMVTLDTGDESKH